MVTCLTCEASQQKPQVLCCAVTLEPPAPDGPCGGSEHMGQRLPLACGLGHHLLQVQSLAQLLASLLLAAGGRLQSSRAAVRPSHVQLHVALLGEAQGADAAAVGPLARVLLHMHLQRALLVERLLADSAGEGPLACVDAAVSLQLARFGKCLLTSVTFKHSGLLGT